MVMYHGEWSMLSTMVNNVMYDGQPFFITWSTMVDHAQAWYVPWYMVDHAQQWLVLAKHGQWINVNGQRSCAS